MILVITALPTLLFLFDAPNTAMLAGEIILSILIGVYTHITHLHDYKLVE